MPGRRPKPTALKEIQGNPGKRPLNKREPKPKGTPTCPSHLDDEARKEWRRLSKELTSLGLLTSVDRSALAAYCSAYSAWVDAETFLAKYGKVIKSPSGYAMPNPYVSIRNQSLDQMRKFAIEFGLTPASRSRLQVEPQSQEPDPFAAFMQSIGADDVITNDESTDSELRNESD